MKVESMITLSLARQKLHVSEGRHHLPGRSRDSRFEVDSFDVKLALDRNVSLPHNANNLNKDLRRCRTKNQKIWAEPIHGAWKRILGRQGGKETLNRSMNHAIPFFCSLDALFEYLHVQTRKVRCS